MKQLLVFSFLLFLSVPFYGQGEVPLRDSLPEVPRTMIPRLFRLLPPRDTIPLSYRRTFNQFLQAKSTERDLSKAFIPDPWLMSAVGADLDPFVRDYQLFSLYDNYRWKLDGMVFARKNYVIDSIRSFVYMAGINSIYDERFILNVRMAYGQDYMEYIAPSFTIGYRYDRLTFFVDHTKVIDLDGRGAKQTRNLLDYDVMDGTKVGVEMKVNDAVTLDAFKSPNHGGGAVGVKIKR